MVKNNIRSFLTNGCTIWFTGLPASGKTTLAHALSDLLKIIQIRSVILDGDSIRKGLNSDLGFSQKDREENIRRAGEVAKIVSSSGLISICAFISPYIKDRERVRLIHKNDDVRFVEVFLDVPLGVCEKRDPKGNYKKAREGKIKCFTGIDDPYEPPVNPELVLKTAELDVHSCIDNILEILLLNIR